MRVWPKLHTYVPSVGLNHTYVPSFGLNHTHTHTHTHTHNYGVVTAY